jgi:hypothetical protein
MVDLKPAGPNATELGVPSFEGTIGFPENDSLSSSYATTSSSEHIEWQNQFDKDLEGINMDAKTRDPETSHLEPKDLEIERLLKRVSDLEQELKSVSNKGKLIAQELELFRQRRAVFWSDRFRNIFDAWNLVNNNFQQLKDDSAIFHGGINKFRLQPSYSLLRVPYLTYELQLHRNGLAGIWLAPILDIPIAVGELCIRIFAADDKLLAASNKPVNQMGDEYPVLFDFPPIADSDKQKLYIRVYVQGVDAPVRIFELRHYALGGFGKLQSKAFAGFVFA